MSRHFYIVMVERREIELAVTLDSAIEPDFDIRSFVLFQDGGNRFATSGRKREFSKQETFGDIGSTNGYSL